MRTISVKEITNLDTIHQLAPESGEITVVLSNGHQVLMPLRIALYNAILWRIYMAFNLPIDESKIFWIKGFDDGTTAECCDKIYNELVLDLNLPYMDVLSQVWLAKNATFSFSHNYTRQYQAMLDALSLSKLFVQEPLHKVVSQRLDARHGTRVAEKKMEMVNQELHDALQTPGLLQDNILAPFMKTKLLKRNQLPQMFAMYGCRSDITDEMMSYPISASAFHGLENVYDFATESLSAKKAAFFNSEVIESAQYFARKCRLVGSQLPKLYPGWCGSQVTIPVLLKAKHTKNFIGKYIRVDDEHLHLLDEEKRRRYPEDRSIRLTKKNIDLFKDKVVEIWSPFGCKHTDGVCEHCAGYMHQRLQAYIPPDIHLGVYSATKTVSAVTQLVLSAKHLIRTVTKEYNLPMAAARYFVKNSDAIMWHVTLADKLKKISVRLNLSAIGPITDLTRQTIPAGETFSAVERIELVRDGNVCDVLDLTDGDTKPYLSNYMLQYMRKNYKKLVVTPETVDIPLEGFDFSKSFLRYRVVNDDMVSFVAAVENFLSTQIKEYHSVSKLIADFTELLYNKANIELFYVEMMLRGFAITSEEDYRIPVMEHGDEPVNFGGLGPVISEAALSTKLSFERMDSLFSEPKAVLRERGNGYGFNDRFFNF